MYKRVLVTTEEAKLSLAQLSKGLSLTSEAGHTEWFMSVYHPAFEAASSDDPETEAEARQLYARHRQNQADKLIANLSEDADVVADVCWHPSFLAAVMRQAERYKPDLLVVPRRENSDFLDWLIGGEEQDLVRELHTPLMFANGTEWPAHPRIAVALNPFHTDTRDDQLEVELLKTADKMAQRLSAEMHVVHCFLSLPQATIFDEQIITDYASLQSQVGEEHRYRIEALLSQIDRPVGGPLMQLLEGEVQVELPRFVEEQRIDILILGTNEHSLLERLLLGSTTERLLARIGCDVLVLHQE